MPLTTLAELIAAGAHRTLENVAALGELDVSIAADYLTRRFGNALQPEPGVLPALVGRVQDARNAARITELGQVPLVAEIPEMPGISPGYTYTVIGSLEDPLREKGHGRYVDFPMKFTSDEPMTFEQIRTASEELLSQYAQTGNPRFEGEITSPKFPPERVSQVVRDTGGFPALPKISILSVYRGA
jgi:hypothetical protein